MWVIGTFGAVSMVSFAGEPDKMLVRARRQEDLAGFLELVDWWGIGSDPWEDPDTRGKVIPAGADYPFRVKITKAQAGSALLNAALQVTYHNFKAQITDAERHAAYLKVWQALQELERGKKWQGQGSLALE